MLSVEPGICVACNLNGMRNTVPHSLTQIKTNIQVRNEGRIHEHLFTFTSLFLIVVLLI